MFLYQEVFEAADDTTMDIDTTDTVPADTEENLQQRLGDLKVHEHTLADYPAVGNLLSLAQTLPEVPLQTIFEFLCLEDLTNVQFVCRHWCNVAQSENLWKGKTWILKNDARKNLKYKQQLANMPMLQNIVIPVENGIHLSKLERQNCKIVQTLLLYQNNLRSLVAYALQPSSILLLVRKFSNLQSISVSLCVKNVVIILTELALCKHLNHLEFKHPEKYTVGTVSVIDNDTITDLLSNYFTSLKSLDITYFQEFLSQENIKNILKAKINQLKMLKLDYTEVTDTEYFSILSQSRNIEVDLNIKATLSDLHVLKPVKSIKVTIFYFIFDQSLLIALRNAGCMPNVESVRVCSLTDLDICPLQTFSSSFPSLKCLKLDCVILSDFNSNLVYLKNLTFLKSVSMSSAFYLESEGFLHLSKCLALESLEVGRCELNDNSIQALLQCTKLRRLKLISVSFLNVKQILSLIQSLCNLRTLALFRCDTRLEQINQASITAIKTECRNKNILLEINK